MFEHGAKSSSHVSFFGTLWQGTAGNVLCISLVLNLQIERNKPGNMPRYECKHNPAKVPRAARRFGTFRIRRSQPSPPTQRTSDLVRHLLACEQGCNPSPRDISWPENCPKETKQRQRPGALDVRPNAQKKTFLSAQTFFRISKCRTFVHLWFIFGFVDRRFLSSHFLEMVIRFAQ